MYLLGSTRNTILDLGISRFFITETVGKCQDIGVLIMALEICIFGNADLQMKPPYFSPGHAQAFLNLTTTLANVPIVRQNDLTFIFVSGQWIQLRTPLDAHLYKPPLAIDLSNTNTRSGYWSNPSGLIKKPLRFLPIFSTIYELVHFACEANRSKSAPHDTMCHMDYNPSCRILQHLQETDQGLADGSHPLDSQLKS